MKRELLFYPDPLLRQTAEPVDEFGSEWLKGLVYDMVQTVIEREGVGLAAAQIGVNMAVIVFKDRLEEIRVLCNPKIIGRFGRVTSYGEGCLSVIGFRGDIKRSKEIKVAGQTVDGESITLRRRGKQAIILQHEIDHLAGIEFIDRIPDSDKEKQEYLTSLG